MIRTPSPYSRGDRPLSPHGASPLQCGAFSPPGGQAEVDLLSLVAVLARGWRWLLAGLGAGVLAGALLSALLPRSYTSRAVVVVPGEETLRGLATLSARFRAVGLTPVVDATWLYGQFQEAFSARDGQIAFLSGAGRQQEAAGGMSPASRVRLAEKAADGIVLTLSESQKRVETPYPWTGLAVTSGTPGGARDLLSGWMNACSSEVLARARAALGVQRDGALEAARTRLAQMQRQAAAHRDVQINRLSHALSLARAAGIHRPLWVQGYTLNDDPDFPVSLGETGLSEKLALLKNDADLSALSTALRDQRLEVQALAALSTDGLQALPYRLLASPSLPLSADGAGPGVMMALSIFLGLLAAGGGLLFRDALRAKQHAQAAPAAEPHGG